MIQAKATTPDGLTIFIFGLSEANVDRLKNGEFISVDHAKLGEQGETVIFYGPTELLIKKKLEEAGLLGPNAVVTEDPRLKDTEPPEGRSCVTQGEGVRILGVNTRYYPSQESMDNPPPTVCVLVLGDVGDYAAYVGHGDPRWVARFGNKVSFEEADKQFPGGQLKRDHYRGSGGYEDGTAKAFWTKPKCELCEQHVDERNDQGLCPTCEADYKRPQCTLCGERVDQVDDKGACPTCAGQEGAPA